ncbi:hypothetical protein G6F35_016631 [Rhizopus arrhizus]|nr:hypothetical protein G6F35_016631 [Rhizopus arrhizus]
MPCRAPCASALPTPAPPAARPMRRPSPWPGARPTCATACPGLRKASASVKKGCYPGQEIVARTHFLGKAKRAVQLLHAAAPAQAGDGVQQDSATLGTIASVAGDLALAVLPLEASDADLQVGDAVAQRMPLLDGLAR